MVYKHFLMIKQIAMCLQKWKYKFNPGLTGDQAFFIGDSAKVGGREKRKKERRVK